MDLHSRLGHGAMNLILQTFSAIYSKIQYIRQGYYACGQDPSFAHFKVILADPGYCRTPGMRRWLTGGSLLGLTGYLLTYPLWWMVLKSPDMGAQSFLYAAMEEKFSRSEGGVLVKECKQRDFLRTDVLDESKQKMLWEYSEQMVQEAEKRGAQERAAKKTMKAVMTW